MTKNVFNDLGFSPEESEDLRMRVKLIDGILQIVKAHGYSQKELQTILKQPQSEISYLLNGKISRFSSEKLLKFLNKLDAKVTVEISIPKHKVAG